VSSMSSVLRADRDDPTTLLRLVCNGSFKVAGSRKTSPIVSPFLILPAPEFMCTLAPTTWRRLKDTEQERIVACLFLISVEAEGNPTFVESRLSLFTDSSFG